MGKRICKADKFQQEASDFMRRMLTNHKFILIPYKSRHDFCHYPTTNLFVFFRYFAGKVQLCGGKQKKFSKSLDEKGENG